MKQKIFIVLFSIFLLILIQIINADIVSINSGGSDQITIGPGSDIEGFFSCIPRSCGNQSIECGTTSNQCGVTIDCGSCASGFTCTSGSCIADSTSTTSSTSSSTGGGGGIVSNTFISSGNLVINPPELSLSVIENVEEKRELSIKNTGNTKITITIEVIGEEIENILTISETQTSLNPNEEKILELTVSKLNGKYLLVGKILMKYSGITKEVPIVIGSKSSNFLFDASVFLSDKFKKITPGTRLSAQFDLIQVSSGEKVDVVANYIIKDFEGNKYYEESETFFVLGKKDYIKEFPTENLEEGKYVLGFEIVYPGAFAVSSASFDIEKPSFGINTTTLIIISSIIFISIIALFWNIVKRKKFRFHKKNK